MQGRFDACGRFTGSAQWHDGTSEDLDLPWPGGARTDCGPFAVQWACLPPIAQSKADTRPLARKLEHAGGIHLYRQGVRILPYGRPGHSLAEHPVLTDRCMYGIIELPPPPAEGGLQELAHREGLRDNAALREFRALLDHFLAGMYNHPRLRGAAEAVLHRAEAEQREFRARMLETLAARRRAADQRGEFRTRQAQASADRMRARLIVHGRRFEQAAACGRPRPADALALYAEGATAAVRRHAVGCTRRLQTEADAALRRLEVALDTPFAPGPQAPADIDDLELWCADLDARVQAHAHLHDRIGEQLACVITVPDADGLLPTQADALAAAQRELQQMWNRVDENHAYLNTGLACEVVGVAMQEHLGGLRTALIRFRRWAELNEHLVEPYLDIDASVRHLDAYLGLLAPASQGLGDSPETWLKGANLIRYASGVCHDALKQHGIRLVGTSAFRRFKIWGRPSTFHPVLANLVANAVFWLADAAVPDPVIRLERRGASLAVVDNGPGVPEANRTRIFKKGFSTRADGRGLGLHHRPRQAGAGRLEPGPGPARSRYGGRVSADTPA